MINSFNEDEAIVREITHEVTRARVQNSAFRVQRFSVCASVVPSYNPAMKFGRIKRQHGRVGGLDAILDRIVKQCPHVSRIVPGRIKVRRGKTPPSFRIQYPTEAGLKCQYIGTGTVQEVFLICSDAEATKKWLIEQEIAEKQDLADEV
jgi:hypothetical protein